MKRSAKHRSKGVLGIATLLVVLAASDACMGQSLQTGPLYPQIESEQIRKTLSQYAIFLDDGRVEDFLDLFTEDAVFTADEFAYVGREQIRTELAAKKRRAGKHMPFPALIEFESATEARAWSDFIRVKIETLGDPTSWTLTSIGRYYDQLVRGEDGRWRFARRDVQLPEMKNLEGLVEPSAR